MKYLKRFNEELSPELLKKVAGNRETPQKQRIGAQADLRTKLQDPEYVKAEAQKKVAAEKKQAIVSKYPIFTSGMGIKICLAKLENVRYSRGKRLTYEIQQFWAEADFDEKSIELSLSSEGGPYLTVFFEENGLEFDGFREFIFDEENDYNRKVRRIDTDDPNAQISIVGFERGDLNKLSSIIKELYPNSNVSASNFYITDLGESKKAGIWDKDFDDDEVKLLEEDEEFKKELETVNKFAVPSIKL